MVRRSKNQNENFRGFLIRLRTDVRGNTLAIVAAAIFPLLGMIGGAVDISRLYLVRTRLQQACDAGALAGRKSMTGLTWATSNETTANQFFDMNFPTNRYDTGTKTRTYTASNTGTVTGTASVAVPMTLMKLFSMTEKTVAVTCQANLQLPNTDVIFVLDTTLSMYDTNPSDTQNKITILRSAVTNFYNQLESVKAQGSVIRYGFVPYSSTVNVGMLLQRDWVQDQATYDSRVPDGTSVIPGGTQGATKNDNDAWVYVSGSYGAGPQSTGSAENCVAPANSFSDTSTYTTWSPSSSALPRTRTRTRTRNGTTYSASLSGGVCRITSTVYDNYKETQLERVIANPNAGDPTSAGTAYHWIYQPVQYSMANLKGAGAGNSLVTGTTGTTASTALIAPVANNHANRTITWTQANACIEERRTRRVGDLPLLNPRYDMDIDLVPDSTDPDTQWKPYLPGVTYGRRGNSNTTTANWDYSGSLPTYTRIVTPNSTTNYYTPFGDTTQYGACPTKALKLAAITSSALTTYLNSLTPAGFTYHDIGMLWGLRLISRDGIFKTENRAAEATGRIARNIIFMTDGDTDTRIQAYDAWGLSAVARRRTATTSTPTDADQDDITNTRLAELCTIAKTEKNITVWVIAFGTTLTTMLSDCASPGRAYQANNAAELATAFSQIAAQIAQLRLVQ